MDEANGEESKLRRRLQEAGLSRRIVSAAWPTWWTEELSQSPSARAELRFALARRLGLEPKPLLGERVEFVWKDHARFKHLGAETLEQQQVLSSFAVSVGRILTRGVPSGRGFLGVRAEQLRADILQIRQYVDLPTLAMLSWSFAVPVVHLRVFPLETKAMHAMVVAEAMAGAIMLGRDASYPASAAFTLAHEIGHLALGHVSSGGALIDVEDPVAAMDRDREELEADAYALTLLTGSPQPDIDMGLATYNAPSLAAAVLRAGPGLGIEPGTLALCIGHQQRNWPVVMTALKFIYGKPTRLWKAVNGLANREMDWGLMGSDEQDFVRKLLDLSDG